MSRLMQAVIVYILYDLLGRLLPRSVPFFKRCSRVWIDLRVSRCVKRAEKKFKGRRLGATKKAWVLQKTQKYETQLLRINATIDTVIEQAVQILNTRSTTAQKSLTTSASAALDDGVQGAAKSIKNTITREE